MRITVLYLLCLLTIGCQWGTLSGSELTGSESVLSESLSSTGVLPPFGTKYTVFPENAAYTVLVTWDSAANAKEYEISVTGDKEVTERVGTSQYSFPVSLKKEESFNAVVTIKTININDQISVAGAPLTITFGGDSVYSETVHNFYASKGTETSLKLTYTPAKGADRYMLERRRTSVPEDDGKDVWEMISPGIVNANVSDPEYYYYDQTAKEGYRYDYRITPIDSGGIAGESRVTRAGFTMPLVRNLRAGQGGEGLYDTGNGSNKGIFAVEWTVQSVLLDASYTETQDGVNVTDVPVSDEALSEILGLLSFEIRVASGAGSLDNKEPNFSSDWGVSAGISFFSNYNGSNFQPAVSADGFSESSMSEIGGAVIYSRTDENTEIYRIYVIADGAAHSAESPVWGVKGYFQVRPRYGNKYTGLPWSNKASGYVVDSAAAALYTGGAVSAVAGDGGIVTVEWTGTQGENCVGWNLYRKKEGEAEFTVMEDIGLISGNSFVEVSGLAAGSYQFGVAGIDANGNAGIIFESAMVTVADTATE